MKSHSSSEILFGLANPDGDLRALSRFFWIRSTILRSLSCSLRTGFKQDFSNWRISEFLRVDNLFDKEYVGSIRVADLNENYFEPAPTRNYLLGINASYQFK